MNELTQEKHLWISPVLVDLSRLEETESGNPIATSECTFDAQSVAPITSGPVSAVICSDPD